ncbi:MAG: TIGR01212 family radical SAM protein [Lachnospiraceae bacterium]
MNTWGEKPYHSLDYELKHRFGEKIYKLTLNGGMSCPNRDGKISFGGCIFCSGGGSGEFASSAALSVTEQIQDARKRLARKRPVSRYIAYFQAYTNTYGPVEYLRKIFTEAIEDPEVAVLSIATRPDCLDDEIIGLLGELNRIKPVWIELGLQTVHESTARFIRRGYPLSVFETAAEKLQEQGIETIVHVILGLPGETREMMLETVRYLNTRPVQGIKLQLLHVLSGTDLALYYENQGFRVLSEDEYIDLLIDCVENIRPETVIHRITGDGPKDLLIAPLWSSAKRTVLNHIHHEMKVRGSWQGKQLEIIKKEEKTNG